MSGFTMSITCEAPFERSVQWAKEALADAGFGVLTEIDLQETLAAKLGKQIPSEVILGACNPQFAYAATRALPSIAALLPCNVVVRWQEPGSTMIEIFDPAAMARLGGDESADLVAIVEDVRELLSGVLDQIAERSHRLEEN